MNLYFWKIRKTKYSKGWEVRRGGKKGHIHLSPKLSRAIWRCLTFKRQGLLDVFK
jgi:hypothetical protein